MAGDVNVQPEIAISEIWFSPTGSGRHSAPADAPGPQGLDPITTSEILSELESLSS
ncbi:hypothetical protein SAMN05216553_101181 [Lentzea fradiae]|uniref:Uncharacterized protein n=1 Tax=Lentzea fradiae TaxID=200378 RepID=A0A1G7KB19_9PSEU|nr:hypothetical protein [Lentzea fradiae]SDF34423.1 hypothetical protein SAMN05216553_101181 [Lentzea fradiae]